MHQKPFLSLKTSLFQVYGNIEIVEGYSSQTYSGGKQFNSLEEYSPLQLSRQVVVSSASGQAEKVNQEKEEMQSTGQYDDIIGFKGTNILSIKGYGVK